MRHGLYWSLRVGGMLDVGLVPILCDWLMFGVMYIFPSVRCKVDFFSIAVNR